MADDFGDDAGQQIFDWALRLGMEGYRRGGGAAGQRAVEDAMGRLEAALENARDAISRSPGHLAEPRRRHGPTRGSPVSTCPSSPRSRTARG